MAALGKFLLLLHALVFPQPSRLGEVPTWYCTLPVMPCITLLRNWLVVFKAPTLQASRKQRPCLCIWTLVVGWVYGKR